MEKREWMRGYLDLVRAQLHWKYARPVVLRELEDHLLDQRDACLAQGMSEQEAEAEALRQMGDPVTVGLELDRVHLPRPAWEILSVTAVLATAGLLLWFILFFDWDRSNNWSPLLSLILGVGVCALVSRVDVNRLGRRPLTLFFGVLAVLLLVWLASCKQYGSYDLRMYTVLLPVGYAGAVYALRGRGGRGLALCGGIYGVLLLLCLYTLSWASAVILSLSAAAVLLLAVRHGAFGPRKKLYTALILAAALLLALGYLAAVWDWLSVLLRPNKDIAGENYMQAVLQGMLAHSKPLGPGERFEMWPGGTGTVTVGSVLEMTNMDCDFLLTAVAYSCGWMAALALLAISVCLPVLCLRRAFRQQTLLGSLLSCAVAVPLAVQTVGYVLGNLGYPLGSFELPLLSFGGTFTVLDFLLLGLLLAVSRCGNILRDQAPQGEEKRYG